jgi:hypothetical protein
MALQLNSHIMPSHHISRGGKSQVSHEQVVHPKTIFGWNPSLLQVQQPLQALHVCVFAQVEG